MKAVLGNYLKTFEFFFEDFRGKNKAPMSFMVGVLTNLDCAMYKPGDVIIPVRKKVEELIIIEQGYCKLFAFIPSRDNKTHDEK